MMRERAALQIASAAIAAAFTLGSFSSVIAQESQDKDGLLTLAPAGEWKLREYPDKCRASRVFGEGEERTTLWIDQGGREPSYNVTMIGEPLKSSHGLSLIHI